ARAQGLTSSRPLVYTLVDRVVLRFTEPPPRVRVRAPRALMPLADRNRPANNVMKEFFAWHAVLDERLRRADGIDLERARERSPAAPFVKWSLGMMFAVTLAHERRHIWQARQVRNDKNFPSADGDLAGGRA